jgi:hypothetical protein
MEKELYCGSKNWKAIYNKKYSQIKLTIIGDESYKNTFLSAVTERGNYFEEHIAPDKVNEIIKDRNKAVKGEFEQVEHQNIVTENNKNIGATCDFLYEHQGETFDYYLNFEVKTVKMSIWANDKDRKKKMQEYLKQVTYQEIVTKKAVKADYIQSYLIIFVVDDETKNYTTVIKECWQELEYPQIKTQMLQNIEDYIFEYNDEAGVTVKNELVEVKNPFGGITVYTVADFLILEKTVKDTKKKLSDALLEQLKAENKTEQLLQGCKVQIVERAGAVTLDKDAVEKLAEEYKFTLPVKQGKGSTSIKFTLDKGEK